ncbi:MAG: phosphatase PAP2 family protein [Anaerolineales bacterium]|nr:phosphatase PAP2 family protein [Anaerolineales bacterium]
MRPSIKNSLNLIKNNDEAIARWISHVISPHIVGVVITSAMALQYSPDPIMALVWLAGLMPLLVLPPLGYLVWLVRRGKLADIYMPERETRLRPLTLMMVWLLACLGMIRYWEAPVMVELFVLAATVMIGILSVVTLFWKISFHGATITAAATATMLVAGSSAWPVMLLVPLVGWARVRLERHTPRQVIFGSLVGALIALILVHGVILRVF